DARRALELVADVPPMRGPASAALAQALLQQGRTEEALAEARRALELLEQLGVDEAEVFVRLVHADALAACGRADEARAAPRVSLDVLHERAARLDERWRRSFLDGHPDNAATLARAAAWGLSG